MYPEEEELLDDTLSGLTDAISTNMACSLNAKHIETIIGVLERWPASHRFPGTQPLHVVYIYTRLSTLPRTSYRPRSPSERLLSRRIRQPRCRWHVLPCAPSSSRMGRTMGNSAAEAERDERLVGIEGDRERVTGGHTGWWRCMAKRGVLLIVSRYEHATTDGLRYRFL